MRGAGRRAVWAAGGTGRCVVVLSVCRSEHLPLGAAEPAAAAPGQADPAAAADRGDADDTDGDCEAVSASSVRAQHSQLGGAAGDLCVPRGGGGDSAEDMECDPDRTEAGGAETPGAGGAAGRAAAADQSAFSVQHAEL